MSVCGFYKYLANNKYWKELVTPLDPQTVSKTSSLPPAFIFILNKVPYTTEMYVNGHKPTLILWGFCPTVRICWTRYVSLSCLVSAHSEVRCPLLFDSLFCYLKEKKKHTEPACCGFYHWQQQQTHRMIHTWSHAEAFTFLLLGFFLWADIIRSATSCNRSLKVTFCFQKRGERSHTLTHLPPWKRKEVKLWTFGAIGRNKLRSVCWFHWKH